MSAGSKRSSLTGRERSRELKQPCRRWSRRWTWRLWARLRDTNAIGVRPGWSYACPGQVDRVFGDHRESIYGLVRQIGALDFPIREGVSAAQGRRLFVRAHQRTPEVPPDPLRGRGPGGRAGVERVIVLPSFLESVMGSKRSKGRNRAPESPLRPAASRLAPNRLTRQAPKPSTSLARAGTALERSSGDHEAAERALSAASAELREQIAERERLEEERRRAEQGLREVRARFESAFTNAPIGMALVDMDGRWLQVNDALCRITGLHGSELKATTLRAITHPDDVDRRRRLRCGSPRRQDPQLPDREALPPRLRAITSGCF